MASPTEKHIVVLPFVGASHFKPLATFVLKLASATPTALFSFLISTGNEALLSRSAIPANAKVYDVISSPWDSIQPGKSRDEIMQQFLQGAPEIYERAIEAAEEAGGLRIDCLMTDAFYVFAGVLAKRRHMKWIVFWVPSPHCLSAYIHSDLIIQKYRRDDDPESNLDMNLEGVPGLSMMQIKHLPGGILQTDKDDKFILYRIFREFGTTLPRADAVILSSYEEVMPANLVSDLKSKFQKLFFIGSPTVSFAPPALDSGLESTGCLAWLDKQRPRSVAYISFGTVEGLSSEEMSALAEALEEKKTSYLWSLKDHQKVHLPTGFEGRTRSKGKIIPWAPQTQVLWHRSVGVHVTHCGYNSVLESVAAGVPMISRPLWADNKFNGVVVEEDWGVGVTVAGGTITKAGMLKCLETVMDDCESGKKMRQKIKALKEVLIIANGPNGSASRDFDTLLGMITSS